MMIEDEYRKTVSSQHAPESLIRAALKKISEKNDEPDEAACRGPQNTARRSYRLVLAAAACFLLIFGGAWFIYSSQTAVYSAVSAAGISASGGTLNLGHDEIMQKDIATGLSYCLLEDSQDLPKGILSGKPQSAAGFDVYFGEDKANGSLYAAFSVQNRWELLTASDMGKKEFTGKVNEFTASLAKKN